MRSANVIPIGKSSEFYYYEGKKKENISICFCMAYFAKYDNRSWP